jgi:ankyrin repeat protein
MNANLPARKLPGRPDLDQLKRQAKELLDGFAAGESSAVAEVREYYRDADPRRFALHDAQLVLARAYGFDSWPKLKACVDGVTAARLHEAVEKGELGIVKDLLRRRPEIVNRYRPGHGERLALHIAVLRRDAAMSRLLMENGANARSGIWPYRKETQAITIAAERGYDELVAIIQAVELQRQKAEPRPAALPSEIDQAGPLTLAVKHDEPETLALLLERGFDPDERRREPGSDEIVISWGQPLAECTNSGKLAMAEMLLARGADPNAWACVWNAYRQRDSEMIALLSRFGGVPNAATPGYLRDTELAARMFAEEAAGRLPKGTVRNGNTVAEEVLDPAASAGATDILRMALERIDWQRDDPRWFGILASPLCFWNHIPWIYSEKWDLDRSTYLECFALVLDRCHANVSGRFGMTILHYAAASYNWVKPEERVAFVETLLNHGARMDVRDDLLRSTPLGWACRWGRLEVATLLLERGADPLEADAEPWAAPRAWAEKMGQGAILGALFVGCQDK